MKNYIVKNSIMKKLDMTKSSLRFCALTAASVLMLSLAACGKENTGETESSSQMPTESVTESVTESSSQEQTQEQDVSKVLKSLAKAVKANQGDNYWPDTEMPAEYLEMTTGLTSDMYEDFIGEMPMISANVDTLLIVKAAEGQEDAVLETIQAYQDKLKANTMQYPMNLPKIQASQVERMGSYICFVLLGGDPGDAEEQGDEAMLKVYQERNEEALNVIRETLGQ